jgi:hypothetical protein
MSGHTMPDRTVEIVHFEQQVLDACRDGGTTASIASRVSSIGYGHHDAVRRALNKLERRGLVSLHPNRSQPNNLYWRLGSC